jgi:hypothetical protein
VGRQAGGVDTLIDRDLEQGLLTSSGRRLGPGAGTGQQRPGRSPAGGDGAGSRLERGSEESLRATSEQQQ